MTDFRDNGDGTLTDPESGLTWKRCVEGVEAKGGQCDYQRGRGTSASWAMAMQLAKTSRFAGKADWRLPSLEEAANLVRSCQQIDKLGKDGYPGPRNSDGSGDWIWTFSPCENPSQSQAQRASFGPPGWTVTAGYPAYCQERNTMSVLLVRSAEPSAEFARAYDRASPMIAALQDRERERRREQEERLVRDRAEQAAAQERDRLFAALLNSKDPQAMYLAAGRLERQSDNDRARQVYEKIIDRFASSPFALKANDRLLDLRRDRANENARRDDSSRARQACEAQRNTCLAGCPAPATGARLDSSARVSCVLQCERIKC